MPTGALSLTEIARFTKAGPLRTLRFERAARACGRPIAAQRLAILLVRIMITKLLARRAAVHILRRQIDEVLLAEAGHPTSRPMSSASAASP